MRSKTFTVARKVLHEKVFFIAGKNKTGGMEPDTVGRGQPEAKKTEKKTNKKPEQKTRKKGSKSSTSIKKVLKPLKDLLKV